MYMYTDQEEMALALHNAIVLYKTSCTCNYCTNLLGCNGRPNHCPSSNAVHCQQIHQKNPLKLTAALPVRINNPGSLHENS
jgi:hypothetical protein